jgi:hypothetical protein
MYLIHADLQTADAESPPQGVVDRLAAIAVTEGWVEHVAVHRRGSGRITLGLYVRACSLAEAEERTAGFCRHALASQDWAAGWALLRAEAPLVTPLGRGLLGPTSRTHGNVEKGC